MFSTWTWKAKFRFRILGLPGTSSPAPSPGLPPLPPLVAPFPIPCVGTAQPARPSAVPPTHPPQELPWPPRSCSDTPEHGEEPAQSLKVVFETIWMRNSGSWVPRAWSTRRGRCVYLAPRAPDPMGKHRATGGPEQRPLKPGQRPLLPTLETKYTNKTFSRWNSILFRQYIFINVYMYVYIIHVCFICTYIIISCISSIWSGYSKSRDADNTTTSYKMKWYLPTEGSRKTLRMRQGLSWV